MASSVQRLLSERLWRAGRCSFCGQLQVRTLFWPSNSLSSLSERSSQQGHLARAAFDGRGRNTDLGSAEERYQGDAEDSGGTKSFRGWGKFSKPSTWGTKSKKVWKSKQATQPQDSEEDQGDIYPARKSEPFVVQQKRGSDGLRSQSQDTARLESRSYRFEDKPQEQEPDSRQYGVRKSSDSGVMRRSSEEGVRRGYNRPEPFHMAGNQQPWVRGENSQQVYNGLRKQVREGEEEDLDAPSAARDLQWGQQIDFKVYQFTPLGMRVIIRGGYDGLVYNDQIEVHGRERIQLGDIMKGYVFKIRDDNKVDVSLRAFGKTQYETDKAYLEEQLLLHGGFIPLNSRSPPEEIAANLKLSKSGFKKAVGGLMKIGRAMENEEGVFLIEAGNAGDVKRT